MKRLCFIWIILTSITLSGKTNVDSLHQLVQESKLSDSSRWAVFDALISHYGSLRADSTLYFAEEFYAQAEARKDQDAMARALLKKGGYYEMKGDFTQARDYYHQSLEIYEELENQAGKAKVLINIGNNYAKQADFSQALDYYHQSLEIQETLDNPLGIAQTLNNMGMVYKFQSNYPQALEYQERSLHIHESLDNPSESDIASTLINLGNVHSDQGEYTLALAHYNRSLKIYQSLEDQSSIALALGNIGTIFILQGDFTQGEDYAMRSLRIYQTQSDQWGIIRALSNTGLIYQNQGAYTRALDHYQRGLKILKKLGDPIGKAIIFQNIGLIYQSVRDNTKALEYFQLSLEIFEKIGDQANIATILGSIGTIHKAQGDSTQALNYLQRALAIHEILGSQSRVAEDLAFIGDIYRSSGDYHQALTYYQRGLEIAKTLENQLGIATGLTGIGNVYSDQSIYAQAKFYGEKALPIARRVGNKKALEDVSHLLYTTYKAIGQSALALKMYELSIAVKDSLNGIENQNATISFVYEQQALQDSMAQVEQKLQTELAFQQQLNQKDKTRNILIALGLIVLILAVVLFTRNRFVQRTNAQLKTAKERVEQAEAAKTRLYTNITHEFRTPLTVIQGMSEKVIEAPDVWGEKGGELIRRNSDQLLSLVNQMLDLRKLESNSLHLQMVQGDIIAYLSYIVESFHSLAESKEILMDFQSDTPYLLMDYDPQRILQIVSNLLSNAIKFTPEEGTVGLRVQLESPQKHRPSSLHILVSDTGIGIPQDDIPHIFDRFYQVDGSQTRKGEGTGIGLSLTNELVHLLKGRITARSREDEGTTFEVILPISKQAPLLEAITLDKRSPLSAVPAGGALDEAAVITDRDKPLVLLIEDNADVVQYLIACLDEDYRLEVAMDGQQGIDKALALIPDLVITDVMMPEKDGFEVTQFLKNDERTSHIPIVMLTAKADVESKVEGLERGADAYLPKPFHPAELQVRLRKLLELRLKLRSYYLSLAGTPTQKAVPPEAEQTVEHTFVQKVRTLVEDQLLNPDLKVETLCRELGMSHSQLHRKLTALTGYSTNRFIRFIRLSKARNLLKTPGITISEAAYDAGFSDPDYFSRTFKKEYGMTPTAYRETLG